MRLIELLVDEGVARDQDHAITMLDIDDAPPSGDYPRREPPMGWNGRRYDSWRWMNRCIGRKAPDMVPIGSDGGDGGDWVDTVVADLNPAMSACIFHGSRIARHHAKVPYPRIVVGVCHRCAEHLEVGGFEILSGESTRIGALLRVLDVDDPSIPDESDDATREGLEAMAEGVTLEASARGVREIPRVMKCQWCGREDRNVVASREVDSIGEVKVCRTCAREIDDA